MSRAAADKPYVNFSQGLVTEVTKLNYPENTLLDVDNMDIDIDGSVRRRLGLQYETAGEIVTRNLNIPGRAALSAHVWKSVGGDENKELLVVQNGLQLVLRNLNSDVVSSQSSALEVTSTLTIDMSLYLKKAEPIYGQVPSEILLEAFKTKIKTASGFGCLFIFSPWLHPTYLDYNRDTKEVRLFPVGGQSKVGDVSVRGFIGIRDFSGVEDFLPVNDSSSALSMQHLYNLLNQGWPGGAMQAYKNKTGKWPNNTQQWVLGKDSEDKFDAEILGRADFGKSPAPRGRTVFNAIDGSRDNLYFMQGPIAPADLFKPPPPPVAGIPAGADGVFGVNNGTSLQIFRGSKGFLSRNNQKEVVGTKSVATLVTMEGEANEPPVSMWSCGCFFAGRLWLSGDDNKLRPDGVYFSQIIQEIGDAGKMYQTNDPTSEILSDLLDSDGGVLFISEAGGIRELVPMADGVLVLARKGIWYIRGSDSGFRATDYSVDKVSDIAFDCDYTVVNAENGVYFLTTNGVYGVGFAEGGLVIRDISADKIFSFYKQVPTKAWENASAIFDRISKKVFWFYRDTGKVGDDYERRGGYYNKALILDTRTGAFSKYTFPIKETNDEDVAVVYALPRNTRLVNAAEVDVVAGSIPILVGASPLVANNFGPVLVDEKFINNIKLGIIRSQLDLEPDETNLFTHLMDFRSIKFADYVDLFVSPMDYESYLVTQPESLGDLQRKKSATYVHSFFKKTEAQFVGGFNQFRLDRPSSAMMQGNWDWHQSNAGNRFTSFQQAYKFKRPVVADPDAEFDNGEEVVYTKLKLRGSGRALSLRYQSEPAKDLHLLGVSISFTANGV